MNKKNYKTNIIKNIIYGKTFNSPLNLFIKVIFLIFLFYELLQFFGYEFIRILIIPAVFYSFITMGRNLNIYKISLCSILFLVIFDNDIINFTDLKLRYWYFIILLFLIIILLKNLKKKFPTNIKFSRSIVSLIFLYFICFSFLFLLIDDLNGKLYNIKYWIFTIGLIYVLLFLAKESKIDTNELLYFWLFVLMFSNLWGVLQFFGNNLGFAGDRLQHDWYNISPSAFFSERTWYGQYAAVGIIISFYFYLKTKKSSYIFFIFLFLIGVTLSFSRSALIPLLGLFLSLIVILFKIRIKLQYMINIFLYFLIFIIILKIFNLDYIINVFSIFEKFNKNDPGIIYRYEAIELFLNNVIENPIMYILGNGFSWDESQVSSIGTAIGAKSANIFFMIFHIFGILGLFFSVFLALRYLIYYFVLIKSRNEILLNIGLSLYLTFLGLSFTVPAHQYPPTLVILFFSIFIFKKFKEQSKGLICKK